jgi:nicotinamidase-related amidase
MEGISRARHLLSREESLLVVIDAQERLVPVINEASKTMGNIVRLVRFARILGLPVVVTEQEKLGPTVPEVAKELMGISPVSKIHFNCFFCDSFKREIEDKKRDTLILAGIEAHICVAQTALYGLSRYSVHVVSDAIASRTAANHDVAIERMRQAGAVITSVEMLIYELLQQAGTEEFKAALQLVK